MAALTFANLRSRVQRIVPTTQLSAAIDEHILERLQYLVSIEEFPFQERLSGAPHMTANQVYVGVPSKLAILKSLRITDEDYERKIDIVDPDLFNEMFPDYMNLDADTPTYGTVKEGESRVYFNCKPDLAYALEWEYYEIPIDATLSASVTQLTELAKLTLVKWAAADTFRGDMGQTDRGDMEEREGDKFFMALKRRYQLALEKNARFISQKELYAIKRGY